mmetsp:Transcript_11100/g.34171  ORF Transcript_11100/g.34171 Transcript_11100/m.34171 type:complete len:214 (-) Transcript_11100:97-738(-)
MCPGLARCHWLVNGRPRTVRLRMAPKHHAVWPQSTLRRASGRTEASCLAPRARGRTSLISRSAPRGAPPTRPVPCSRIDSRAPTGSGSKVWNPDDPVRNVGNETVKTKTQREAAKLPRHVHHVPCTTAVAGVCTPVLASAGISGPQPWLRRSSEGTKMQNCARGGRRNVCVNDPGHCASSTSFNEALRAASALSPIFSSTRWQPPCTKFCVQP